MKQILPYAIIFSAGALVLTILLQNQGGSLGAGFGGETNFYRSRRGAEKILFYLTIVLAVIFVASVLATIFLG